MIRIRRKPDGSGYTVEIWPLVIALAGLALLPVSSFSWDVSIIILTIVIIAWIAYL